MTYPNYMIADLKAIVAAVLVFPVFVVIPGLVFGWLLNLFGFRARRTLTQLALSIPLSLAICPVLTFWVARFGGFGAVWAAYGLTWAAFAWLLVREFRNIRLVPCSHHERWVWVAVLVWAVVAIASLMHLQIGDKLYYNHAAYDYSVRAAFTAAITRSFPPSNPFFTGAGEVPLHYHYFWMLICALPAKLLRLETLPVMYAGSVWVGIGLISTIALFLKFVVCETERLVQRAVVGAGLLLVTGLDLLPTFYYMASIHRMRPDIEWWNEVQVASWVDSMLWVPHYLAALIAGIVGWLLISEALHCTGRRRVLAVAAAGLSFASAIGLGVYVALVFAVFCIGWIIVCVTRNWMEELAIVSGAWVAALIASLPFLTIMLGWSAPAVVSATAATVSSGGFLEFKLRPVSPVLHALAAHGYHNAVLVQAINFISLPLYYAVEFGFFLLAGVLRWRSLRQRNKPLSRSDLACWTLLCCSILVGTFLSSTSINSNDLGMRSILPAQFVLLVWAAGLVSDWWSGNEFAKFGKPMQMAIVATLVLGVAATVFQVVMLRFAYVFLDQRAGISMYLGNSDGQFGARTMAIRQAFEALKKQLPSDASVQGNPATPDFVTLMLFNEHPYAAAFPDCGAGFGGDPQICKPVAQDLIRLFDRPEPSDSSLLDTVCRTYGTSVLLVRDVDPVWDMRTWVWQRPAMYANERVRVLPCGDARVSVLQR